MKKKLITLCFSIIICASLSAQKNASQYQSIDDFVAKLGSLDSQNVASIAQTLTSRFTEKEQKARAIFFWIANNIALDVKAVKGSDERKSLPEDVVKYRKATSLGFAKLFQEMSSQANIRCLVVDGYVRKSIDDLNNPSDEINHSWNVIQLGTSPDLWFFADAAKASGTLDKKMITFIKDFTTEYFFADRALFNLDHYPDNDAWQLGGGPKSLKDFYAMPVIYNAAYHYGLKKPTPSSGFIKAKTKVKTSFSLPFTSDATITNVSLVLGDERKLQKPEPMNFTSSGGAISFSYQFKTEDTFPVKIVADGKTILEYMVEVTE
jgi:Transglutaminase-like superfamily